MDPSVMFIFGSIVIGLVFTKTGLTRRLAYKMLIIVGENTSMIYLGCFRGDRGPDPHHGPHRRGRHGLSPPDGHLLPLWRGRQADQVRQGPVHRHGLCRRGRQHHHPAGCGPGAVAIGFFKEITGKDITFFELTYYMFPVGWFMVFLIWGFFMIFFKPEKKPFPDCRERPRSLYAELGPITGKEIFAVV